MRRLIILLFLIFSFIIFRHLFVGTAIANLSSCSASSSPTEVNPNTNEVGITFNIGNTSSETIRWFRIKKPLGGISYVSLSLANWEKSISGDYAIFVESGSPIGPGGSVNAIVTVGIGDIQGQSGNWLVEGSDDFSGANPVTCTGSLSIAVTGGGADNQPPVTSALSVSNISSSSATFTWNTNEPSDSYVEYGLESFTFSLNKSNSTLVSSHTLSVSNLGASTQYYYQVCSTDASGNQGCSGENTFTTQEAGSTTTTTATPAPTTTTTTTTATVAKDTSAPKVIIDTDLGEIFETPPQIEGKATDNEGVEKIDYSTDGGINWLPVDNIDDPGDESTDFNFTPFIFDDGNYEIVVRAIDEAGNVGTSSKFTIVIDRLPPRVGGTLLSLGPQTLQPNENGVFVTLAGLPVAITLSAVGGPISIDLAAHTASSSNEARKFSLARSPETELWNGTINLSDPGLYKLTSTAVDGAGNRTERDLGDVLAVEPGFVTNAEGKSVKNGEITVFTQDALVGLWAPWDAATFGQENPLKLNDEGSYQFFLPPGKYYLKIRSPGRQTLTSVIFTLVKSTPLNSDFKFTNAIELTIFGRSLGLLDIFAPKAKVILKTSSDLQGNTLQGSLGGREAHNFNMPTTKNSTFNLSDSRGKALVLSFINTWAPPAIEQIAVLDRLITNESFPGAMVVNQSNVSKTQIFQKKGKYDAAIVVDRDGELVEPYNVSSIPTHFFIDRRGIIKRIVTSVLNQEELKKILEESI